MPAPRFSLTKRGASNGAPRIVVGAEVDPVQLISVAKSMMAQGKDAGSPYERIALAQQALTVLEH